MNKHGILGAVAAVLAATSTLACSAGDSPGQATGESAAASTTSVILPHHTYYGPAPTDFAPCGRDGEIPAQFVLRLPDDAGSHYGFNDGYSLPFPTPWITYDGGTCSQLPGHCVVDQKAYNYEQKLANYVPGIVGHQFLVYDVTVVGKGFVVGDQQWFYNGSEDTASVPPLTTITGNYAQVPGVEAGLLQCIYVLQAQSNGQLVYTGYHAYAGQSHDPINWPN